ncbi:hypothetical protein ABIB25_003024 [Nakamurella sp. UYEF19]|uniref:hypothetical protein n=1 Tax=Nakamurella sp. UYEF19 TaxID=1756392 RepID=UPI00339B3F85
MASLSGIRRGLAAVCAGAIMLGAVSCTSSPTASPSPSAADSVRGAAAGAVGSPGAAPPGTGTAAGKPGTSAGKAGGASTSPGRKSAAAGTTATVKSAVPKVTVTPLPAAAPQHSIPKDSQIKDTPALRTSILLTGCSRSASGWEATGTAKNSAAGASTFRVLVFFTDKYSRVIDSATTEVVVKAGQTHGWTARQKFKPPAGTQCVLRAVRKT